ncbi:hypothetical protein [Pelagibaculum spongiae]|nr:hypothetical protein [Pelagibaculum spongiae]
MEAKHDVLHLKSAFVVSLPYYIHEYNAVKELIVGAKGVGGY